MCVHEGDTCSTFSCSPAVQVIIAIFRERNIYVQRAEVTFLAILLVVKEIIRNVLTKNLLLNCMAVTNKITFLIAIHHSNSSVHQHLTLLKIGSILIC